MTLQATHNRYVVLFSVHARNACRDALVGPAGPRKGCYLASGLQREGETLADNIKRKAQMLEMRNPQVILNFFIIIIC